MSPPGRPVLRSAVIWAGGMLVAGLFLALEARYGHGLFSRGGSALVAYGVLIGYLSAKPRVEYSAILDTIQSEQVLIAQLMHYEFHQESEERRKRASAIVEEKFERIQQRLERMRHNQRRFSDLANVELPIILIGTTIWGFGDLLTNGLRGAAGA